MSHNLRLRRAKNLEGRRQRRLNAGVDARATMWDGRPGPSDCRKRLGKLGKLQRASQATPQLIAEPQQSSILEGVRSLGAVLVDGGFVWSQQGDGSNVGPNVGPLSGSQVSLKLAEGKRK